MKSELHIRTLSDLEQDIREIGMDDVFGLCKLSVAKKAALKTNPNIESESVPVQMLGLVENKVVGQETVFPVHVKADDKLYTAMAGSGLFVHELYRKSMLGISLITKREELSADGIALGCGLSQLALPAHLMFDYRCFPLRRLIWGFKSRAVIEKKFGRSLLTWFLRKAADVMLAAGTFCLSAIVFFRTCGLTIEEMDHVDETIEKLINNDERPFACEHSVDWLNWQLKYSFSDDARSRQKLFAVREPTGQLLGFFMVKIRFHKTASQRGYKNLLLGSLLDWQSADQKRLSHATLALLAVLEMRKCGVDAVEICTDEKETLRCLTRLFFHHVGELSFVMRATESSPLRKHEGWDRQENWRLRPSDGDNGLS